MRLRFVELTLGLGGWNCGLNTLGSDGVCRVNEGVRRAAFDEGVRLTGTLRLGEVACSATSSDSIAAARCVFFTGVFMTPLGPPPRRWLLHRALHKLFAVRRCLPCPLPCVRDCPLSPDGANVWGELNAPGDKKGTDCDSEVSARARGGRVHTSLSGCASSHRRASVDLAAWVTLAHEVGLLPSGDVVAGSLLAVALHA